jgi:hypothetical protein
MSEIMIAVGKCSISDGLLFYNPATKTIVSSADYKLDTTITSGPKFNMEYRPGNWIYTLDESTSLKTPIFKLDSTVLVHTHSPPHVAQVIDLPSALRPNIYTVKHKDGSIVDYKSEDLELAPKIDTHKVEFLPSWIKEGANCTLYLKDMDAPKHGKLYHLNGQWEFLPGTSSRNTPITLKDLLSNINDLLSSAQIFKGHAKFPMVLAAREQYLQEKDLHTVVA